MGITFKFPQNNTTANFENLDSFKKTISHPATQFFHTFEKTEFIQDSKDAFNKFKSKKVFVHVGIGGSSLGPEMLVSALAKNQMPFIFINNIDPDEISSQLKQLEQFDINQCLFYFVSKSGGTAETLATLSILTNFLEKKNVGLEDLKNFFIFATDPHKSELLDIAQRLKITTLTVPSDVGGRFSVLTPVGYLPALFAGINIDQLLAGAIKAQQLLLEESADNPLLKSATILFDLKENHGINQTVLMPYSSKLKAFSFWFTQLWAESLGKKKLNDGTIAHTGLTPIVSYGATDQHSQMQLFIEGPKDKAFFIIEVEHFDCDFNLSSKLNSNNLAKLSRFTLSQLMKAELIGAIQALQENHRPVFHLKISQNDEFHMGLLILFFESLTAMMGNLLKIDAFNQPGVEAGKIYAFDYLNQLK